MGRHIFRTDDQKKQIVQAVLAKVKHGITLKEACIQEGVAATLFIAWCKVFGFERPNLRANSARKTPGPKPKRVRMVAKKRTRRTARVQHMTIAPATLPAMPMHRFVILADLESAVEMVRRLQ